MASVELPDINQYVTRGKSNQSDSRRYDKSKIQKLATIKSVDKFIKSNDVTSVLGKDNNYYPKQLEDQKRVDETSEVHSNLNSLKRSCDELKRKAQLKEKEIEKMRKEIDEMTRIEDGVKESEEQMKQRKLQLQKDFEKTKKNQDDAQMNKKTYEHMLSRMKKDQLIYQLRANTSEVQLKKNQNLLHSKSDETQKIHEDLIKTELALQEVIEGIEEQNNNRERNLQRFKDDLKIKQDIDKKREDRIKRQQEIAEIAANDIRDSNLKKWRKLLLVHKFLNQFLKLKMQREIKKFQGVEQAFQKIKAATGVTDANEIVKKFLGREQTYSHLLISIAEYEKRIETLKHEQDELKEHLAKLKNDIGNADRELMDQIKDESDLDQDKIVAEIEEKALNTELLRKKLVQWIEKNLTKIQRAGLLDEKAKVPGDKEGFQNLIQKLREQLLVMKEDEQIQLVDKQLKTQKEEIYETEFQKRNVRVKVKQTHTHMGTSFSQDRDLSYQDEENNEMFDQISKIDDDDKVYQEEVEYFRNLREDVRIDGKKKK